MYIKICGITSGSDARMVATAGANAIGLNFYSGSPRAIGPEQAAEILQSLPPYVDAVGLFVDSSAIDIRAVALPLGLKTIQLHGHSVTPETISDLRDFAAIPSFPISDAASVSTALEFIERCRSLGRLPSAILIDAQVPGKHGGTGQTAPWPVAKSLADRSSLPVLLAGGLTAKNVGEAIRTVRPWGVDVASGVEVAPGRKEKFKVQKFINEVRSATRR